MNSTLSPWWGLLALVPVALASPSAIAAARRLPDRRQIYALNAVGIVVFSCWFAALGWSILGQKDRSIYQTLRSRGRWVIPTIILLLFGLFAAASMLVRF